MNHFLNYPIRMRFLKIVPESLPDTLIGSPFSSYRSTNLPSVGARGRSGDGQGATDGLSFNPWTSQDETN